MYEFQVCTFWVTKYQTEAESLQEAVTAVVHGYEGKFHPVLDAEDLGLRVQVRTFGSAANL